MEKREKREKREEGEEGEKRGLGCVLQQNVLVSSQPRNRVET
jgi:hypothetical protein